LSGENCVLRLRARIDLLEMGISLAVEGLTSLSKSSQSHVGRMVNSCRVLKSRDYPWAMRNEKQLISSLSCLVKEQIGRQCFESENRIPVGVVGDVVAMFTSDVYSDVDPS